MRNEGNPERITEVMKRAVAGKPVTVGFIGGSITQGAAATDESLCYASRVERWWRETFPKADVKYVNAGIGATTSQFGAARAEEDLLRHDPDFIIVEYSVNDNDEKPYGRRELFKETYEGLIRRIYTHKNPDGECPAILILHSVRYDDGGNEEGIHSEIGRHYGIPCISMKELIYEKLQSGKADFSIEEITKDMLHPTDFGHGIVAGYITKYLDSLRKQVFEVSKQEKEHIADTVIPTPLTMNRYQSARRYNNRNCTPTLSGFTRDNSAVIIPYDTVLACEVRDVFKNGWKSRTEGDSICFSFTGTELAIMYRKSVKKPAPVAYAVIDGDERHRIRLDANFDEDWGDKAYLATLMYHGTICEDGIIPSCEGSAGVSDTPERYSNCRQHILKVTIEEAEECEVDFYIINIVCS